MEIALDKQIKTKLRLKRKKILSEIKLNRISYAMIAPYMILFFLFTVLPVVSSIVLSFTYFNMLEFPKWVGWLNYRNLFLNDDVFVIAVKNTLIFAFLTGPVSYFACLIFAWFINELSPKIRAFMTLVFYAPSISGNLYFIWTFIFSGDSWGLVNSTLMNLGIIREPVQWLTDPTSNMAVLIIVQLWLSLGTGFLAFIAGFQIIDKTLYEAGAIDGIRNRFQELIYITLPSMSEQLLFGAVMQISVSFAVSDVSRYLCGFPSTNYSAHTIVLHIQDYGIVRYEMGYASAIAVVLFMVMILTNKLIHSILARYGK